MRNFARRCLASLWYWRWKLFNLRQPFYRYYEQRVISKTAKHPHPTLGSEISDEHRFAKTAEIEFNFLCRQGMARDSRVLDYGCGGLRLGALLIEFLDEGNYVGADVTDGFVRIGRNRISDLVAEKKPTFFDIGGSIDALLDCKPFDFIVSTAVLYHIPDQELNLYLENMSRIMSHGTRAYIDFTASAAQMIRTGEMTWHYSISRVLSKLPNQVQGVVIDTPFDRTDMELYPKNHKILELRKCYD